MRAFLTVLAAAMFAACGLAAQERGPETGLPLPRFVSMKASEGFARHGPGQTHKIDWVYKHSDQPLEIIGEYGHWRRVRDQDGAGGWMHYSLLSGSRTVIVQTDLLPLRRLPDASAQINARAELGVVAKLLSCTPDWCRITASRQTGWVPKTEIWGVIPDEVIE